MLEKLKANQAFSDFFTSETLTSILRSGAYLLVGLIVIRLIIFIFRRITANKVSQQSRMIVDKVISYSGVTVLLMVILSELGVNLTAILGAAGVLGIVIGVASQKSLGNMVSGLFLLSEKSFEIGDVLMIDDKFGIVQDVDLLSLKIRTFDNKLIRIPNETLISTMVTNITKYPIRRVDLNFSVAYGSDLERAEETLRKVALDNPLVLNEPEPLFLLQNLGDNGISLLFGFWCLKDDFVDARNSTIREILAQLKVAGIQVPFPQITIHSGPDVPEPKSTGTTDDEKKFYPGK
jgi:small-conductance mechanosensitive channel